MLLTRRAYLPAVCGLTFLVALSSIPYLAPVSPTASDSFLFGYNNRIAELIIAAGAVLVGIFGPKLILQHVEDVPLVRRTLIRALAITAGIAMPFMFLVRQLGGYDESIYLVDRVSLLLEHRVPYQEFEYAYGASFLYGPAYLAKLFHDSAAGAYSVFWFGVSLAGVVLLYFTIQWIDLAGVDKRRVFLLLWMITLPVLVCTGLNYSLLRFLLPCFFALYVNRRLRLGRGDRNGTVILACWPMFAVILLVSPEMALSFGAGIVCFLVWSLRSKLLESGVWLLALCAGIAGTTYAAARLDVFRTLLAFRSGGMNFPLMPAPHLLLFYFAIGLLMCFVAKQFRSRQTNGMLALTAVSALSGAAALGRCDPGHVLLNCIGIWIATCMIAAAMPAVWRYFQIGFVVVFLLLPLPNLISETAPRLVKILLPVLFASEKANEMSKVDRWVLARMTKSLGAEKAQEKFSNFRGLAQLKIPIDLATSFHLPPGTVFEAPFSFTATRFGTYHAPSIAEGYYFNLLNVVTPDAVQRKLNDLSKHPERPLLLLEQAEEGCSVDAQKERTSIRHLFFYPYAAPVVHSESILSPVCAYIRDNYHVQERAIPLHYGYALWRHN